MATAPPKDRPEGQAEDQAEGQAEDQRAHRTPAYHITVDGRDITPTVDARLVRMSITEGRANDADQLDLELTDHDGRLALPPKEATITVQLGWAGQPLTDKGDYVVDEVEHSGAPDVVTIRARAADLTGALRQRTERSWHDTTLGAIVAALATRNALTHKIDAQLAARAVAHLDQASESDMHFLSRLARLHDAVATVKKKHLLFLPIDGTKNSQGQALPTLTITRASGDGHRYSTSARDAYDGVRAYWTDHVGGKRKAAVAGKNEGNIKVMKETFASEAAALDAARAELQRLARGTATLELRLAWGRPDLGAQSPVKVQGFKAAIDGEDWLTTEATHTLDDNGLTTRVKLERNAEATASAPAPQSRA